METANHEKSANKLPPMYWLLRRIGINVPNPKEAPFVTSVLLYWIPFGVIWGAFMALSNKFIFNITPDLMGITPYAVLTGFLFGVCMTVMNRRKSG